MALERAEGEAPLGLKSWRWWLSTATFAHFSRPVRQHSDGRSQRSGVSLSFKDDVSTIVCLCYSTGDNVVVCGKNLFVCFYEARTMLLRQSCVFVLVLVYRCIYNVLINSINYWSSTYEYTRSVLCVYCYWVSIMLNNSGIANEKLRSANDWGLRSTRV